MSEGWPSTNIKEYSVTEISGALKRTVEDQFGYVRVRAELSGVKHAASGHLYFALKDEKSVLDGVCWRGQAAKLGFRPEDGLEVICTGKLTTYAARSKYQMVVDTMEPAGAGALMALLDERRKKLAAEGLFDATRKKALPYLPETIGVVTSPTGAIIRDILHRLNDRFPRRVLLWPVLVQGEGAADQIAEAVKGFNAIEAGSEIPRPDLLIVARGGGSIEDLWSFNEEAVVRAVAASDIPVISAVGHETDTTLVDYAADLRAPTPTGAAEMAVPVKEELALTISDMGRRLALQRQNIIQTRSDRLKALGRALPKPSDILGLSQQRFDELAERLPRALSMVTQQKATELSRLAGALTPGRLLEGLRFRSQALGTVMQRLEASVGRRMGTFNDVLTASARMLETVSYQRTLDRGFALVQNAKGTAIAKAGELTEGERISLTFSDGTRGARVEGDEGAPATLPRPKKQAAKSKKKASDDGQGNLF